MKEASIIGAARVLVSMTELIASSVIGIDVLGAAFSGSDGSRWRPAKRANRGTHKQMTRKQKGIGK